MNPHRVPAEVPPEAKWPEWAHEGLYNGAYHGGRLADCPLCLRVAAFHPERVPDAAKHAAAEMVRASRLRYFAALRRGVLRFMAAVERLLR